MQVICLSLMFKIKQQYRRKNISKCSEGNPRRNIRTAVHLETCVMICSGYLAVSESCPLLSLCYLPTRHKQLDKCFVWPSKFVFLPFNCDFISLGQATRRVCVCLRACVWVHVCLLICLFVKKIKGLYTFSPCCKLHPWVHHFNQQTIEQAK